MFTGNGMFSGKDVRRIMRGATSKGQGKGMTSEENTANGQYFSAHPETPDVRRTLKVKLRGHEMNVETSHGVFSMNRVDLGTSVLLRHAPEAPKHGRFLDLGCGWGPVALSLAQESPDAQIVAVDVNERAVELTSHNAQLNGFSNVSAFTPTNMPTDMSFDLIWSNPPIRIGKADLHALLMQYLARLSVGGDAYLVVQKNLGADSLRAWLDSTLNASNAVDVSNASTGQTEDIQPWTVEKTASSKGFRILHLHRNAGDHNPTGHSANDDKTGEGIGNPSNSEHQHPENKTERLAI
ncbi:MFS transporter [Bifidobacterium aquikefiri]|uniref:MFS transporter n=2 Tax=Bifidobacterium aquikefiri TaxID=1653207 RepID=A0A261G791_9BIFI|nr:MFS transporter [Bifidobacterium aquikefiri]